MNVGRTCLIVFRSLNVWLATQKHNPRDLKLKQRQMCF